MIGAIAGDIIGSPYEGKKFWMAERNPDFQPLFGEKCRYTDDTVLTICVADYLMNGGNLVLMLHEYTKKYQVGYGPTFRKWVNEGITSPYNSFGNGAAMRVSSVAYLYNDWEDINEYSDIVTRITHDHEEGIRGAVAVSAAIYLAKKGKSKELIKDSIDRNFGYDLDFTIDQIRPTFKFDVSCQGTVPPAIKCFLESTNYESAVRLAVSLGGDTDTLACITGGIAGAYYGVPIEIYNKAMVYLPVEFRNIISQLEDKTYEG
jgi:ADP-ribosylglycohydrolase